MLARLLRFTIAMEMLTGACLWAWLGPGQWGGAATVLGALLAALLMPPLGNLCTVWYSGLRARGDGAFAPWCRAMLGEWLASVDFFVLRQPWAWAPPGALPAAATPARVPVLLVHGFVSNYRIWDRLAPALRAQGHPVLSINLEPLFTSIDDYAPQLEQAVQQLRQQTGQAQVALLCHSMGGLAARAWMRRFGTAHVRRVITLGTPHAGTQAVAWYPPINAAQMAWQSAWLQALAASETPASRALLRIALTLQDNIVYPQRAQTLSGAATTVFDGMGHVQLCSAPAVRQWVCADLAML